jgi:hypothetical protein
MANEVPTSRAIGKVVNELFVRDRTRMRGLIERQLAMLSTQTPNLAALDELHLPPVGALPRAYGGGAGQHSGSTYSGTQTKGSHRSLAIGFALVVVCALLLSWWKLARPQLDDVQPEAPAVSAASPATMQGAAQASHKEPEPAPAAAPAPAPLERVEQVALRISVLPASAQLFLDGQPLPSNPYSVSLAKSDEHHTIRAEASGYRTIKREISYDEDAIVELSLEPVRSSRRPSRPRPSQPVTKPPEDKDKPAGVCDVPFYLDEKGIRRVKRECL